MFAEAIPPRYHFVFLMLPGCSLLALTAAIETLRVANYATGDDIYRWTLASLDGQAVAASSGMLLANAIALRDAGPATAVFVCAGDHVERATTPDLLAALRQLARSGTTLGSLCTGGYALARAGLLDGHQAAIHWENLPVLRETFPRVHFTDQLFVIDRDRLTCSGGVAPLHLMLHVVRSQLGPAIAPQVSRLLCLERIRGAADMQYVPLRSKVGTGQGLLLQAAELMQNHVEDPLQITDIASCVGVSKRQIERLFRRYVGQAPSRYYLELRLRVARELLQQTTIAATQVALACGFRSHPHFSKCFSQQFGHSPNTERKRPAPATRQPARHALNQSQRPDIAPILVGAMRADLATLARQCNFASGN